MFFVKTDGLPAIEIGTAGIQEIWKVMAGSFSGTLQGCQNSLYNIACQWFVRYSRVKDTGILHVANHNPT